MTLPAPRLARPAAPRAAHPAPGEFLLTLAQLALATLAVRAFALEASLGLGRLMPWVLAGFAVHAWLPSRARTPFFVALSMGALAVVLGPAHGAIAVGLALGLAAVCLAPVGVGWRALGLALAAALLAALLAGRIETSWARAVVPVVASMFVFRAMVFLYDAHSGAPRGTLSQRLAYFFLLPNACFLLFPVVDWRTFHRTHADADAHAIHQRGMRWILRGIVHLCCYRLVYLYVAPPAAEVADLLGVARFVASSYLLYLRVSGHFHLAVGILHLFGFHLPETNHRWLLPTSFTDCWRRINVYWMELMKKLVYFPALVRLRRRGELFAMAGATALVFVATWLLHAWQWFWLHGSWPRAADGLFWAAAGGLALVGMLWEARRRGGPARLTRRVPSRRVALARSLRGLGVVAAICLAWSLWCTESLEAWSGLLAQAARAPRGQVLALLGGLVLVLAAATGLQRVLPTPGGAALGAAARGPAATTVLAAALALVAQPPVQRSLGPRASEVLAAIGGDTLSRRDRDRVVAGYYDRLIERSSFGSRVAEEARADPDDPEVFRESAVAAEAEGPLRWQLAPSAEETFEEAVVTTNRFGMRDREYAVEKAPGTVRIAVLGACYEMGTGVSNDEVWEAVAERSLNGALESGARWELLNFSVAGYDLLQLVTVVREKVPPFQPDLVVVSNHLRSSVEFVLRKSDDRSAWPAGLEAMVEETRQESNVDWEARLEAWALAEIAETCRQIGARPVFLNVPAIEALRVAVPPQLEERIRQGIDRALGLGYVVLDVGDAFEGERWEAVAIPHLQRSPNAHGHRLLSERFTQRLLAEARALDLPAGAGG